MRILLVRHGQSEWNASRRLQGQADIALSDTGRKQAERLRPVIEAIRPCRAISSDLARVVETAKIIGAPDAAVTKHLRENDVGRWTGRPIEEIEAEDPSAYRGWRAGKVTPVGGEPWPAFSERVCSVLEAELQAPCRNLLVVCHGGVIRAILQRYLKLEPENIIPAAPASLSAIRLSNGGEKPPRLELFNFRPGSPEFEAPD